MKILRNSVYGLISYQKQLLYRSCVLSIILYKFQLQFYNRVPLLYLLKKLRKIQRRVAIQILSIFQTLSSFGIKTIVDLTSIYLHLCKLSSKAQFRAHTLSHNYILRLLLESRLLLNKESYCFSLDMFTPSQCLTIKSSIVDMDNRFNKVFPTFDLYNKKFSPSSWIIDLFPSHFSFYSLNKCSDDKLKLCSH